MKIQLFNSKSIFKSIPGKVMEDASQIIPLAGFGMGSK